MEAILITLKTSYSPNSDTNPHLPIICLCKAMHIDFRRIKTQENKLNYIYTARELPSRQDFILKAAESLIEQFTVFKSLGLVLNYSLEIDKITIDKFNKDCYSEKSQAEG